jgi:hypothetical protein
MNKRQLKTKPGAWYSAEKYVPATPGLYQVKMRGLHKFGWTWFNGKGFCGFVLDKHFAVLYGSHVQYESNPFKFRGLVKVDHEH